MESEEDRMDRMNRNSAAMENLVSANTASNATMLSLIESVRGETAARDRKIAVLEKNHRQTQILVLMVCAATLFMLTLGVINAVNISRAKDQQMQIRQINNTLLDCLNSTGTCGQVNQANQARILEEVKRYELTGFYCIRTNPATADPKGESFLKCMKKLYPGGPELQGRWP